MKTKRTTLSLFFLLILITACTGAGKPKAVQPIEGMPSGTDGFAWWNDTIFYEVFVRSFYDSNGDGIGDLNGLIAKLDYLNDGDPKTTADLGVTGLWLMPINPSPSYHGYDVSDYYAVNPQYGTMEDFKRLIEEAHQRGMRVIMDLVMNHTSNQHPWFRQSIDPTSAKRDWYIWSDTDPGYRGPWAEQVWYKSGEAYYYAVFWDGMPDLNFNNPEVREEMKNVSRFWLEEVGVDGFRLDAAKHILEEGQTQENTPTNHAWWKEFRTSYKAVNPNSMVIGEVWSASDAVVAYLQGDELDMVFNFDLADLTVKNVNGGLGSGLGSAIQNSASTFPTGQYGTFLTNHDQNRSIYQLGGDIEKAKNAATVLLTIPGVPFLYYGEEIGMTGFKPDERIRTPMQWASDEKGGFTTGYPWQALNMNFKEATVAGQTDDPDSLLSHYRTLIQLRNHHAALRVGSYTWVNSKSLKVLAFVRQSKDETVLVILNLGKDPVSDYGLTLTSSELSGKFKAVPLLGEGKFTSLEVNERGGFIDYLPLPELPGYGRIILQLQEE